MRLLLATIILLLAFSFVPFTSWYFLVVTCGNPQVFSQADFDEAKRMLCLGVFGIFCGGGLSGLLLHAEIQSRKFVPPQTHGGQP